MAVTNKDFQQAMRNKKDEFYTQLTDIEKEMKHYKDFFRGKIVFCNCDDPEYSNFWRFFQLNFYELGLKKLISTHYEADKPSYRMDIVSTDNGEQCGIPDYVKTPLKQNGDFRSPECIEILKEADIVITNPPFSLFREYIAQLIEYKKHFIILGNVNAITYKEIFPLLKSNQMWLGYRSLSRDMYFDVPTERRKWLVENKKEGSAYKIIDGVVMGRLASACWYTNLDHPKRHSVLETSYSYSKKDALYPDLYPKYDNYDAINVDKVTEIPMDYFESWGVSENSFALLQQENWLITRTEMIDEINYFWIVPSKKNPLFENYINKLDGYKSDIEKVINSELYCSGNIGVPITFFDKYNPNQFEIINANDIRINEDIKDKPHGLIKDKEASITINSPNKDTTHTHTHTHSHTRTTYARIVVRNLGTRC